jgi:hypothetical protein
VIGTRKPDGISPHLFQTGDYGLWDGEWYGMSPNGLLAGLAKHQITIHEDGTITVSPSILVRGSPPGEQSWHGYLKRGVWEECT